MSRRLSLILVIVLTFVLAVRPALAQPPVATVNGGGQGLLTDPYGNSFPVQFAFAGTVNGDGSASGHINFVFHGEMAAYWGAVPGVDTFHVFGQVTGGSVAADGTVTLQGTATEMDFDQGNGRVFIVLDDPFTIVTGGSVAAGTFTLVYCLLPPWDIAVTSGQLNIH